MPVVITAAEILGLLAAKHFKDVFVAECKTGSTAPGMRRMDAWAMRRSWAHSCTTVYEIKVDRSDFLRDRKTLEYLPYCNELYFVCPPNLISPGEVPEGCGLLWTSVNCRRLYTKRKAPHRAAPVPQELYQYILMWRARITSGQAQEEEGAADYWRRWLKDKKSDWDFGHHVSRQIREFVEQRVHGVEEENNALRARMERYERFAQALREIGIDPDETQAWEVERRVHLAVSGIPIGLERDISQALAGLQKVREHLSALAGGARKKNSVSPSIQNPKSAIQNRKEASDDEMPDL